MMKILLLAALIGLAQCASIDTLKNKESRISGGTLATQSQFPYMVSIQAETAFGQEHICGGTILNDNHVLTSASCIDGYGARTLHAVAGEQDLTIVSEYEEDRVGSHIELNGYAEASKANDIAILRVSSNFVLISGAIEAVTLPASYEGIPASSLCFGIGWGSQTSLTYGEFTPMFDEDCRAYHGTENILIDFLCAYGSTGVVASTGDGGGPLICDGKQFGIFSWSLDDPTMPAVTTEVSHYIDWIELNTSS